MKERALTTFMRVEMDRLCADKTINGRRDLTIVGATCLKNENNRRVTRLKIFSVSRRDHNRDNKRHSLIGRT